MAITDNQSTRWDTSGPPHNRPSRRGSVIAALIGVVVFVLVLAGIVTLTHHGGSGGATTQPTTTPNTAAPLPATSTTIAGTSTNPANIPAAQPNPPSLAGAYVPDPITVLRTLSAYSDWLFAHPNPALLENYMLPQCTQYNAVKAELTTLANNGWHAQPSEAVIQWAKVNVPFKSAPGLLDGHPAYVGGGVKAVIINSPQSSDILNKSGQIVTRATDQQTVEMLGVNFAQGSDGRFRIISEGESNPPGGITAFEAS